MSDSCDAFGRLLMGQKRRLISSCVAIVVPSSRSCDVLVSFCNFSTFDGISYSSIDGQCRFDGCVSHKCFLFVSPMF